MYDSILARKALGAFFTAYPLALEMTRWALEPLVEEGITPTVIDPACGDGVFLEASLQVLGEATGSPPYHLARFVAGVDIDGDALVDARIRLAGRASSMPLRLDLLRGDTLIEPKDLVGAPSSVAARLRPVDLPAAFPHIFDGGGFDAVVSNPPYVFGEFLDPHAKDVYARRYQVASGQTDLYRIFIERSLELVRPGGMLSVVVPDSILARDESEPIRRLLLEHRLERIYPAGQAFDEAGISVVVLVVRKGGEPNDRVVRHEGAPGAVTVKGYLDQRDFMVDELGRFLIDLDSDAKRFRARVERSGVTLGDLVTSGRGEELGKRATKADGVHAVLTGDEVQGYHVGTPTRYVDLLKKKPRLYEGPKIVVVKTGERVKAALDTQGYAALQSLYCCHLRPSSPVAIEYVLGLLDAAPVTRWIKLVATSMKRLFPQINLSTLRSIPLPAIRPEDPTWLGLHDELVALVREALDETDDRRLQTLRAEIDKIAEALYEL